MKQSCLILLLILCAAIAPAQEWDDWGGDSFLTEEMSLYGYVVSFLNVNLYEDAGKITDSDVGETLYLRLKGDWSPEEYIDFHLEAAYMASFGNMNYIAMMDNFGFLPASPDEHPYDDFIQNFFIDHAWASVALGPADLQFGKLPIGWGTGYAFNPTARTYSSAFLDTISEETPGTFAIVPSVSFSDWIALQGYLGFQERSMKMSPLLSDGDWNNLPFGLKIQGVAGAFDLSASFIKEVTYISGAGAYERKHYLGLDFVGAIWDFGVYGEAVLSTGTTAFDFSSFSFWEDLEFCFGFDYIIPGIDVTLRSEYYHQGGGVTDKSYSGSLVLAGKLLAEDYLFVNLERLFFDFLNVMVTGFINLNDGSLVIAPMLNYDIYANFQVMTGGILFVGSNGSEFRGEFTDLPGVDLTEPQVFVRCKVSF